MVTHIFPVFEIINKTRRRFDSLQQFDDLKDWNANNNREPILICELII